MRGYESYLTSHEIVVDFTCPEPGKNTECFFKESFKFSLSNKISPLFNVIFRCNNLIEVL